MSAVADQPNPEKRVRDMRFILDQMPAMIGYWDRDLINRFANQAYLTWFGIECEQILGKHLRHVIGEERYRLNLPYIEGALKGIPQSFERAIPSPDGAFVRHSLAEYIPDIVDGEVRGFCVMVSDISTIVKARAELKVSNERYRAIVEDQTEIIMRIQKDGTVTFVNEVFCRFFGKQSNDIIGTTWYPLGHPEDIPGIEADLCTLSADRPVVVIENRVYAGSGELRWMQFVNRGIFDADEQLIEIQSVGRDITERKSAELALIEVHEQLEKRVIERTEQLRGLTVQMTLAEERERQAIARDLHDDLGQILHVARIKFDGLVKNLPGDPPPQVAELNQLIHDASRRVRSLTSQLSPPALRELGLGPALRGLSEELERNYGLAVEVHIENTPLNLSQTESAILFRAARELLINAAKHADSDMASVELTCRDNCLLLIVKDDGTGIGDLTFAAKRGFGLSSVRERILFIGGSMALNSGENGGTCAVLRIPLKATANQESVE
jgi:PAS domain S-box-containing protein